MEFIIKDHILDNDLISPFNLDFFHEGHVLPSC